MTEVEMKFLVVDPEATRRHLENLGYQAQFTQHEHDTYYNAPDRDFAKTDEAFRVRQVHDQTTLTYKGPKQGDQGKIRTELEVALATGHHPAAVLQQMLANLGYRRTLVVNKKRTYYRDLTQESDIVISWDEVERLGTFLEIEAMVGDGDRQETLSRIQAIARGLGLDKDERRSYLELLLATRS